MSTFEVAVWVGHMLYGDMVGLTVVTRFLPEELGWHMLI